MGAITRSTSPFNTSIVVVEQKGKSRVCFDFRKLNKHVENSHYPLPRIRELLERLHGLTFFSTLDLARGYHRLPVTSSSRRLLAFSTQKGKYEWCRLPFGVVMGPMIFQDRIAQITEGLNWNYVLAYIDDIIVITKGDYENHLEVLQQVLDRLRKYPLRLRREVFPPCTSSLLRSLQNLLGKKSSMSDWSSEHDECFEASKLLFHG